MKRLRVEAVHKVKVRNLGANPYTKATAIAKYSSVQKVRAQTKDPRIPIGPNSSEVSRTAVSTSWPESWLVEARRKGSPEG
jgi:hypothetical protein